MNFLKHCPVKKGKHSPQSSHPPSGEIRVVQMTYAHAKFWHQQYQPAINNLQSPANLGPGGTAQARADVRWHWPVMFRMAQTRPGRLGAYCITTPNAEGAAVPVGMLLSIRGYPWLEDHNQSSSFLWFLSVAPEYLQVAMGVSQALMLGRALVDVGIVESVNGGHNGRIGLHAAPPGGAFLMNFYGARCGMVNLSHQRRLPHGPSGLYQSVINHPSANDGRYFYTTEAGAISFLYPWDAFR